MTFELDLNNRWSGIYFQRGNRFKLGRNVHMTSLSSRVCWPLKCGSNGSNGLWEAKHTLNLDSTQNRKKLQLPNLLTHQWMTICHKIVNCILVDILLLNCSYLISWHYCPPKKGPTYPVQNIHHQILPQPIGLGNVRLNIKLVDRQMKLCLRDSFKL